MKQITFLSTLLLFVFIQFAPGQIPKTMSYQGVLTDASGAPVPDGNYLLHFRFYQSPTGGSPIWMENQTVAVTDGIFNVTLGSLNPLTLPFNTSYWLGVTVSPPGPELTPRTPLTAAPYSLSPGGGGGGWSDDGSVVRLTTPGDSVGIGTADPTEKLEVSGKLRLLDALLFGFSTDAMIYCTGGELVIETDDMPIRIHNDPAMYIDYGVQVNGKVEITGPTAMLDVAGHTKTQVLEITGGSDLSEQFDIHGAGVEISPSPGMVVCIDPDHPGELVVSARAYDRRVAGIISGAGGIKPGMLMGQQGSEAAGKNPVALTGRVYCRADASHGAIMPGDLLTTSEIPGHAMKVTDYSKAQGAIIGKAMTALEQGQGLVLVLVTLQ